MISPGKFCQFVFFNFQAFKKFCYFDFLRRNLSIRDFRESFQKGLPVFQNIGDLEESLKIL